MVSNIILMKNKWDGITNLIGNRIINLLLIILIIVIGYAILTLLVDAVLPGGFDIPDSLHILDYFSITAPLLLSLLLVVLYGLIWKTQSAQNEIQNTQTEILDRQETIAELEHKAIVKGEFVSMEEEEGAPWLFYEVNTVKEGGLAFNFKLSSEIITEFELEKPIENADEQKYISWPAEADVEFHDGAKNPICQAGEEIEVRGTPSFAISNANESLNGISFRDAHEKLIEVGQDELKVKIELVCEDRLKNEYTLHTIERNVNFNEPIDIISAIQKGGKVYHRTATTISDPRMNW